MPLRITAYKSAPMGRRVRDGVLFPEVIKKSKKVPGGGGGGRHKHGASRLLGKRKAAGD